MQISSILSNASILNLFKHIISDSKCWQIYVKEYIRPKNGDKILDIGCGIADILEHLHNVEYFGFDMEQKYIETAIKRFGNKGRFACEKLNYDALSEKACFDIVMANGIIHHLKDREAILLFNFARLMLKPGGRLVTLDGCHIDKQSPIVRFLLSNDRGQYIRTREGYLFLASKVFKNIRTYIRKDLLNIPYTHIIMECEK